MLLLGCATTSITNLTPSDFPRTNSGLYRIEATWQSNQKSVVEDSVKPVVIIGQMQYPMRALPFAVDRWETMVPVPADKDIIYYRFKFDYRYRTMSHPLANSQRSPKYRLDITPAQ